MSEHTHIRIPLKNALLMTSRYVSVKLREQLRSVAFIIIYLFLFQVIILGTPLTNSVSITGGLLLVIVGLTVFMEGLLVGLMPLGEKVGLQLPKYSGLAKLALFGLLIGFVSTLAEPAISVLRRAGAEVNAWDAPLLYMLLEIHPNLLVAAIGLGVGLAVGLSMLRYYFGLSLKPFILVIAPILLALSVVLSFDENLKSIIGLAWDAGAVTTGPVTVPLILALGMGISRAMGKQPRSVGGFGSITLASLFPILGVLVLGLVVNLLAPYPMSEKELFSPEKREIAMRIFKSEPKIVKHAFTHGSEVGRRAFFGDDGQYLEALTALLNDPSSGDTLLDGIPLAIWVRDHASQFEQNFLQDLERLPPAVDDIYHLSVHRVMREETRAALRAVIPLTGILLMVLVFILRDRPRYPDEVIFGMFLTLWGMIFLTAGIRLGLVPLGDTVGRQLPQLYRAKEDLKQVYIENFDTHLVHEGIEIDGTRRSYFFLHEKGELRAMVFIDSLYDAGTGRYELIERRTSIFGIRLTYTGIALVLLFAFGMGYGSTLAEPALNALGKTVQDITVGTVKRTGVIRAVSIGVGAGLVAGVARIIYDIPIIWLLLPVYLLLLPLSIWSEEDFVGISWDSGGVTTGPVTVPLVLAMGLGIGGALQNIDGFGVLAMASVFPILSVQMYGLLIHAKQRRTMRVVEQEMPDER